MNTIIKMLLMSSIFYTFAAGLFGPIYAIYVQGIGGDLLAAGTAWAIFSFVTGILLLIFGFLEDHRLNKMLMLISGNIIIAFANIGYLFVSVPIQLFLIQVLSGIGLAITTPAWDALYSKNVNKKKESLEWAYWEGGTRIFYAAAALIGSFIASVYGFHMIFIIMALCSFASAGIYASLYFKNKKL